MLAVLRFAEEVAEVWGGRADDDALQEGSAAAAGGAAGAAAVSHGTVLRGVCSATLGVLGL